MRLGDNAAKTAGRIVQSDWKCGKCRMRGTVEHLYLCRGATPFKLTLAAHRKAAPLCPVNTVAIGGRARLDTIQLDPMVRTGRVQ
jgi:hypothetical protein